MGGFCSAGRSWLSSTAPRGLRNGAPYRVGDYVRILARRQRGRVARVYDVWAERDQVRVELGQEASERVEDVFSHFGVCRVPAAEQVALADDGRTTA